MPKSPEAFRTISEASRELGVAQHVLRFWETKFSFVRPMKRAGGRRFYRPTDIDVLATVRRLLHQEGYTIKGVQKLHREQGLKSLARSAPAVPAMPRDVERPAPADDSSARLRQVLYALETAKQRLDTLLAAH